MSESSDPALLPENQHRTALQHYADLLLETNRVMNLTACKEMSELWTRHILDSLTLLPHLPQGAIVVDIGSGGGFPAIPLAIVREDIRMTMIEATGKKCRFLQSVLDELNLRNARVVHARSEIAAHDRDHRECYTHCTARAVSPMRTLVELALPFLRVGGSLLAMKGSSAEAELKDARSAIVQLGGGRPLIHTVPDSDRGACIIEVPKGTHTTRVFPREPGTPASHPL